MNSLSLRARLFFLLLLPLLAFFLFASFFFYYDGSKELLLLISCLTLFVVVALVFLIADRISKPVRQLNQAAMKIAAGDYGTHLEVEGPREIEELVQTFNTMSQSLREQTHRLRERALTRERMKGEYECYLLLQEYMLNYVVDDNISSLFEMALIASPPAPGQKGLLFSVEDKKLTLAEAETGGFAALFGLARELKPVAFVSCSLEEGHLLVSAQEMPKPLIWSLRAQAFVDSLLWGEDRILFLCNSGAVDLFGSEEGLQEWMARVLRHFGDSGLEAVRQMLEKELLLVSSPSRQAWKYDSTTVPLRACLVAVKKR